MRFLFARRLINPFSRVGCGVGSEAVWTKNFVQIEESARTVGAPPAPLVAPLLTRATFRREFLDADLERFLSVGMVPLEYDIQTQ
ncbi:MAG: hypothetical protein ACREKK_10550 [Candidatus Methylomirabilales bacterium]